VGGGTTAKGGTTTAGSATGSENATGGFATDGGATDGAAATNGAEADTGAAATDGVAVSGGAATAGGGAGGMSTTGTAGEDGVWAACSTADAAAAGAWASASRDGSTVDSAEAEFRDCEPDPEAGEPTVQYGNAIASDDEIMGDSSYASAESNAGLASAARSIVSQASGDSAAAPGCIGIAEATGSHAGGDGAEAARGVCAISGAAASRSISISSA